MKKLNIEIMRCTFISNYLDTFLGNHFSKHQQ